MMLYCLALLPYCFFTILMIYFACSCFICNSSKILKIEPKELCEFGCSKKFSCRVQKKKQVHSRIYSLPDFLRPQATIAALGATVLDDQINKFGCQIKELLIFKNIKKISLKFQSWITLYYGRNFHSKPSKVRGHTISQKRHRPGRLEVGVAQDAVKCLIERGAHALMTA